MSSLILMGNIIIVQFNKKKFDYDLINKVFKIENDENEPEMNLKSKNTATILKLFIKIMYLNNFANRTLTSSFPEI